MPYFAISVDPPDVNKSFAQSLGVGFPLLSDPTKKIILGATLCHAAFVFTLNAGSAALAETNTEPRNAKETKDTKETWRTTGPLAGRDGANGAATQTTAIERL